MGIEKEEFSIGSSSMIRMSKQEMINAINNTFPDNYGTIAVITECKTTAFPDRDTIVTQSVTFGKILDLQAGGIDEERR